MSEGPRGAALVRTWLCILVVGLVLVPVSGSAQQKKTRVMPRVTPSQFVEEGSAMARSWKNEALPLAGDRMRLFAAVEDILRENKAFHARVAEIYPQDQLEWILITDEVADSLSEALIPVLDRYQEKHPDEVLTTGRQLLELELMKIAGPPSRMLGFHVILLADYAANAADSLLARPDVDDAPGVADGVLRNLRDWGALYRQFHQDAITNYESRLAQEDWIIARLKDNCGNSRWKLTQQYMALIGVDSTRTPAVDRFAHELHLEADGCDDSRVIHIELPHFRAMQEEMMRRMEANKPAPGR